MTSIIEILDKRGISYEKTNNPNEIKLHCPSGEHDDNNPSLFYNLEHNIFHCMSCSFKGSAPKFLQAIGETSLISLDSKQPYKIAKLRKKLDSILEVNAFTLPDDRKAYTESFRGISAKTLKEFKAFTTNSYNLTDYLCIPVYQHNKLKFINARLTKELSKQPKYNNKPNNVNLSEILFPIDKLSNTNYVILVEGIYDMLNLWQLGYHNVLCTFGATNFSTKKVQLLDRLGVVRVDIMMDSDVPGQLAAEKITKLLDSADIYSRIIVLPKGVDPGELTAQQAEELLK